MLTEQGARRALPDRHVAAAVEVQEPQGIRGAVPDVGVAADRRDRQQVDLGPRYREPDREGIVEPRVAVDDQRQWMLGGPERRGAGNGARREERRGGDRLAARRGHWLALLVRPAGGGAAPYAPDDARDDNDRHDVRNAAEQLGRDVDAEDRQQGLRGVANPKTSAAKNAPTGCHRRRSLLRGR